MLPYDRFADPEGTYLTVRVENLGSYRNCMYYRRGVYGHGRGTQHERTGNTGCRNQAEAECAGSTEREQPFLIGHGTNHLRTSDFLCGQFIYDATMIEDSQPARS